MLTCNGPAAGQWATNFVQETVDDALRLLSQGQAGHFSWLALPESDPETENTLFTPQPLIVRGEVPLSQLSTVLGRLRNLPHDLVPMLGCYAVGELRHSSCAGM